MDAESTDIFNAITECNRKFMSAFHQGDAQGIAELYSEDAKLLPPGSPPVTGRSAIEGFWDDVLQQGLSRLELKTMELERLGHSAIEIGRARILTETGEVAGAPKYLVVWVNDGNGWKVHRDIWNMDTAQAPRLLVSLKKYRSRSNLVGIEVDEHERSPRDFLTQAETTR